MQEVTTLTLEEGRAKFIETWGMVGSHWGINRTMAMIHALLLVSAEALSAEEVMDALNISRGNANMNLRALIDWGLVHKSLKPGERREYFTAEKDMYTITKAVIRQRKKRELEPLLRVLDELSTVDGDGDEEQEFRDVVRDIKLFSNKADSTLETLMNSNAEWFVSTFMRLAR